MSQKRLNALYMLSMKNEFVNKIDFVDIISNFAAKIVIFKFWF